MFEGMTPVPDRTFVKKLKGLDKRLDCVFSRRHEKFMVTYARPTGTPSEIILVGKNEHGHRQPDQRDYAKLIEGDLARKSVRERELEFVSYYSSYKEKQEREVEDTLHEATVDNRRQLMNTYTREFNLGKGNSTFRRIDFNSVNGVVNCPECGVATILIKENKDTYRKCPKCGEKFYADVSPCREAENLLPGATERSQPC